MESDDVRFYWCMVSSNWEEEVASLLLDMLVNDCVKDQGPFHCLSLAREIEERVKKICSKIERSM